MEQYTVEDIRRTFDRKTSERTLEVIYTSTEFLEVNTLLELVYDDAENFYLKLCEFINNPYSKSFTILFQAVYIAINNMYYNHKPLVDGDIELFSVGSFSDILFKASENPEENAKKVFVIGIVDSSRKNKNSFSSEDTISYTIFEGTPLPDLPSFISGKTTKDRYHEGLEFLEQRDGEIDIDKLKEYVELDKSVKAEEDITDYRQQYKIPRRIYNKTINKITKGDEVGVAKYIIINLLWSSATNSETLKRYSTYLSTFRRKYALLRQIREAHGVKPIKGEPKRQYPSLAIGYKPTAPYNFANLGVGKTKDRDPFYLTKGERTDTPDKQYVEFKDTLNRYNLFLTEMLYVLTYDTPSDPKIEKLCQTLKDNILRIAYASAELEFSNPEFFEDRAYDRILESSYFKATIKRACLQSKARYIELTGDTELTKLTTKHLLGVKRQYGKSQSIESQDDFDEE